MQFTIGLTNVRGKTICCVITCTFCEYSSSSNNNVACCDRGFESHRGHGYLSVASVVCCQIEVSATD